MRLGTKWGSNWPVELWFMAGHNLEEAADMGIRLKEFVKPTSMEFIDFSFQAYKKAIRKNASALW